MGLWKNLKYVLSDECNGLLRLLVDHYNRRSEKNEKSIRDILVKVQQTLDTQEVLDNNMSDSYQELRDNKDAIEKVSTQCESVFSQCETIVSQISQMETDAASRGQEIEQIIGQEFEKQKEEIKKGNQMLAARIREVYGYLEAMNEPDPDAPNVNDLLARIDTLEQINKDYENQLSAVRKELDETKQAYETADKNYQEEKRKAFHLSKKLVQANDKIGDLLNRMKDRSLEHMLQKDDSENPFVITENKDKYTITAANIQIMVTRFANTSVLDQFFESVPDYDPYKKMYNRYQKDIRTTARQFTPKSELEDVLQAFVKVVQDDLIGRMVEALYRKMKTGKAEYEEKLLAALNQYLEAIGFYCRDELHVGEIYEEKDLNDMECVEERHTEGKEQGEILEIETYPYYINFIDKSGRRKKLYIKGSMTIAV
ncbi:hypothetical protein C823_006475 [Eubacterium plexicaudatum ASF492]|uniref:Uncharacterized protein n=1 Tax=Eubacterium plexicaudatum ASF492 TaxID=1235802 RepID=N2ADT4_9FIRM|nr:hypothetical protein C823_006475 [Eubacterium plexicaudatum ASF492]